MCIYTDGSPIYTLYCTFQLIIQLRALSRNAPFLLMSTKYSTEKMYHVSVNHIPYWWILRLFLVFVVINNAAVNILEQPSLCMCRPEVEFLGSTSDLSFDLFLKHMLFPRWVSGYQGFLQPFLRLQATLGTMNPCAQT